MAERTPDNADFAVDELRRKGRRRLVGAIVLALAAAVVVPLLLEKEPRPLGEDVSVQIPPVDESKFVNRLTGKSGDAKLPAKAEARPEAKAAMAEPKPEPKPANADAKPEPKPEPRIEPSTAPLPEPAPVAAAPAPKSSLADAEQRVLSPPTKPPVNGESKATAAPAPKAVAADAKASAAPVPKVPAADAKVTAPKTEAKPAPAPSPAKADAYVVQLAAFADDKGANALANKLKKAGYAAYVEPVETSRGTLWRVRVGGYASRADADAARVKLKGEGQSGIVAAAK